MTKFHAFIICIDIQDVGVIKSGTKSELSQTNRKQA
jgi:hypothetical protein